MERIREAIKLAKQESGRDLGVQTDRVSDTPAARGGFWDFSNQQHFGIPPQLIEQNRIVGHLAESVRSRPYDILRTQLLQTMDKSGSKVLMITSPTSGCGKTLTAINLALSCARLTSRKVALVDLDFRHPSVLQTLGLASAFGLDHYLAGQCRSGDVAHAIDIGGPNLTIIGSANPLANSAELIASEPIRSLIAYLRAQPGTMVIVDLPPTLLSDDVLAFLPQSDSWIMTVAENATSMKDVDKCRDLLGATKYLGCVLNKSSEKFDRYAY